MACAVWYELLPYADLSAEVLGKVAERDLAIYLAVTPDVVDNVADAVKKCRDHGLHVGLWPMVERAHGRWPSCDNIDRFEDFVRQVRDQLDGEADAIILDFEPPIDAMPALFGFDWATIVAYLRRGIPEDAIRRYVQLAKSLHGDDIETVSAGLPLIVADGSSGGWQRFFGTPLDATPTQRINAMFYTSIIEGLAKGTLRRKDVLAVLGVGARAAKRRYGARASISLGAIDVGALGDEQTYRSVEELREDVAITRAAGIEHIALFSLCGAMRRAPIEPWLDAFVDTPAADSTHLSVRAGAMVAAAWLASRGMSIGYRLTQRTV